MPTRGIWKGEGRLLTPDQEQRIQRAIIDKRPEAVTAWLDEHYPAIAAHAKAEGGEIHWGDETALTNTDVRGRSYAPSGQAPVTYVPGGKREKLSMIATVTHEGKARWMIISPELNPEERRNADLKQAIGKKVPVRTKAKLREAANEHMILLAQSPGRIKSFFQDQPVKSVLYGNRHNFAAG